MRNITKQEVLFELASDSELMNFILRTPKLDLHRHVTGSITAKIAIEVASKHNIHLPSVIESELDNILFHIQSTQTFEEYFGPWKILNKLFKSAESVRDVLLSVIEEAYKDNIIYLELRIGPHGFLGETSFSFDEFLETIAESVDEAESRFNIIVRIILGIQRHRTFAQMSTNIRNKMLAKVISKTSNYKGKYFVGMDLNGDESVEKNEEFKTYFKLASNYGFKITAHAGEMRSLKNLNYAIEEYKTNRIGHGLAAIRNEEVLKKLSDRKCLLEICPTSNKILNQIKNISNLPLATFIENNIPFAICTDNPARNKTSLSEEFFKVIKAFESSFGYAKKILRYSLYNSVNYSFVDEIIKKELKHKLDMSFKE